MRAYSLQITGMMQDAIWKKLGRRVDVRTVGACGGITIICRFGIGGQDILGYLALGQTGAYSLDLLHKTVDIGVLGNTERENGIQA